MNKQTVRLDLISLKDGTQQRPLDEDVVSWYLSLMADGVEFPPIEVVSDGPNFWLYDGFHRYRCAQDRGQKTISAYVTKGALRDAIWLSFGANKAHGLPRQQGMARKIIEKILTDTSWSKKSLTAIAEHVGITRQYVTKIKEEFAQQQTATTPPPDETKPRSESENSEKGATSLHPLRDGRIEVQSSRGRTYTQRSQEKQHKPDDPPKDGAGRVIPEHLRELYEDRKTIWQFVSELAQIRDGVMKHLETRDLVFSLLNVTAFQANYENLRRTLKSAMPYAVCCYCGGEDSKNCKACQGFGLLNEHSYQAAPKELKA